MATTQIIDFVFSSIVDLKLCIAQESMFPSHSNDNRCGLLSSNQPGAKEFERGLLGWDGASACNILFTNPRIGWGLDEENESR